MSDFNEMFNLDAEDFKEAGKDSIMYKVSPKGGKNGVYSSLIRFIPWHKDPKNSIVEKWEAWLENPLTKKGMLLDCPSSVGKQSDLMDTYWKLKNSSSPQIQDKAKHFSRKRKFWTIVQILKDDNRPELEGKLMIFKFGPKIYDKIQAELKPEYGQPHVPFSPFDGKPFHIKCKEVGGYPNYDESKFLNDPAPIMLDGQLAQKGQDEQKLMEFLKESSPDLESFGFKSWSDEQRKHFDEMVQVIMPTASKNAETVTKTQNATTSTSAVTETETPTVSETNDSDTKEEAPKGPMNFNFNLDD